MNVFLNVAVVLAAVAVCYGAPLADEGGVLDPSGAGVVPQSGAADDDVLETAESAWFGGGGRGYGGYGGYGGGYGGYGGGYGGYGGYGGGYGRGYGGYGRGHHGGHGGYRGGYGWGR